MSKSRVVVHKGFFDSERGWRALLGTHDDVWMSAEFDWADFDDDVTR